MPAPTGVGMCLRKRDQIFKAGDVCSDMSGSWRLRSLCLRKRNQCLKLAMPASTGV